MSNNRRDFLQKLTGIAVATPFFDTLQGKTLLRTFDDYKNAPLADVTVDETFWYQIKESYTVSPNLTNLNNGGVAPSPKPVQDALDRYNKLCNEAPSYYMWRILDQGREPLRNHLAELAGGDPNEIAINRNSSEGLETVIFGLRLQKGDEVVLTKQDYPNVINAWKQREKRDGIVLKWLSFDFPIEDKALLVNTFVNAFTNKTKVVNITHMINWVGQILPAREIADEAHKRGIEVLVDAAHSFIQKDFKISDLNCDYFATSLHKWLCAPIGSGLLYVKKDKIKNLYPHFAAPDPESEDIRKFENLGTRSFAIEQAIGEAINFHHMIGSVRKDQRLVYLKNYWCERVMDLPNVKVHTSLKPEWGGAIALVSIDGRPPNELDSFLFNQYKIHTTTIVWENISGVRITPNVYTTTRDLDWLVKAIREFAKKS